MREHQRQSAFQQPGQCQHQGHATDLRIGHAESQWIAQRRDGEKLNDQRQHRGRRPARGLEPRVPGATARRIAHQPACQERGDHGDQHQRTASGQQQSHEHYPVRQREPEQAAVEKRLGHHALDPGAARGAGQGRYIAQRLGGDQPDRAALRIRHAHQRDVDVLPVDDHRTDLFAILRQPVLHVALGFVADPADVFVQLAVDQRLQGCRQLSGAIHLRRFELQIRGRGRIFLAIHGTRERPRWCRVAWSGPADRRSFALRGRTACLGQSRDLRGRGAGERDQQNDQRGVSHPRRLTRAARGGIGPSADLVPGRGLEPPRCYPLVPETSASTNSATRAGAKEPRNVRTAPELSISVFNRARRGCRRAWARAPWSRRHAPWDSWTGCQSFLAEPSKLPQGRALLARRSEEAPRSRPKVLSEGYLPGPNVTHVPLKCTSLHKSHWPAAMTAEAASLANAGLRSACGVSTPCETPAYCIAGKQHHAGRVLPTGLRDRTGVAVYADVRRIPAAHRGDVVLEPQCLQGCVTSGFECHATTRVVLAAAQHPGAVLDHHGRGALVEVHHAQLSLIDDHR